MYNNCVASSSRLKSDAFQDLPSDSTAFPTSNLRSCAPTSAETSSTRVECRTIEGAFSAYCAPTLYPTSVPMRFEVQQGVWSDGKSSVLAANHPDVEALLTHARNTFSLPPAPSDSIFALAALSVFYNPGDPAHWIFWSDERKNQTAEVVTRISLHRPPLIRSNVAWNGTPEYLSILANHHGSTWRQVFESKDWFQILAPPKAISPVRVLNLRKRKPAQIGLCEALGLDDDDDDDLEIPPPKRSRARRAKSPGKSSLVKATNDVVQQTPAAEVGKRGASPAPSVLATVDDNQSTSSRLDKDDPLYHAEDAHTGRMGTRLQKRKAGQPPAGSDASASRSSSSTPLPLVIPTPTTAAHSRNRSTSQASAETLIASNQRRSLSVLSAITAVDASNSRKSKSPQGEGDGASPNGSTAGDLEATAPRVTRGSARRAHNLSAPSGDGDNVQGLTTEDCGDVEENGEINHRKLGRKKNVSRAKGRQGRSGVRT